MICLIKFSNDTESFNFAKSIGMNVIELHENENVDSAIKKLVQSNCTNIVFQSRFNIVSRIFRIIIRIHVFHYIFTNIRLNYFHSGQILHVIFAKCRIFFQFMFCFKCLRRQMLRIYKKIIFHITHLNLLKIPSTDLMQMHRDSKLCQDLKDMLFFLLQ